MKLIIGLGNPGKEYHHTRHNIGFEILGRFARFHNISFNKRSCQSRIGEGKIGDQPVILAKPQTYMNLSGQAVAALIKRYKVTPKDIIVIHDDLDLPIGKIRIRLEGGAGGHNGIKSIIQSIGTICFTRIKVGIGRPTTTGDRIEIVDHVLTQFSQDEAEMINKTVIDALGALETMISGDYNAAMNKFN
ncbi:peptidyl-tRNA hydrolase [Dehalogenimonas lykanthroporepellens BL-DC-9]|jgi:PTH1 family peptidyl-tRNA hydrolase|nr:peptidyl-tRNA hydrolase [Dehalogenimonas lykanthroporepellens BL-DC-9]